MSELYLSFLKQGLAIGLAVAAPVGPTSIFCIQKALTKGILSGFISSTGAATANTILAGIGALSLNLAVSGLANHKAWFNLVSGIFLCYLGIKIFFSRSNLIHIRTRFLPRNLKNKNALLKDYGAALLLTSINPLSILPFMAFFTHMHSVERHLDSIWIGVFVLGVFISSVFWYSLISTVANFFSQRVLRRRLHWVNRISGTAIAIFGCAAIYSAWR